MDAQNVFHQYQEDIISSIHAPIRWFIVLTIVFINDKGDEIINGFRNTAITTLQDSHVADYYNATIQIMNNLDSFIRCGSGWTISSIQSISLNSVKYVPIPPPSSYLPLPETLNNPKFSLVNVNNADNLCFIYCILAHLYPVSQHAERTNNYTQYFGKLNLSGLHYPVSLKDINIFEQNNINISVNVYSYTKYLVPLRISNQRDAENIISLLLIKDGERSHYVLMKNPSALIFNSSKYEGKKFLCPYCLSIQNSENNHIQHLNDCKIHGPQRIKMPDNENLKFNNIHKQLPAPVVIYADFESVLIPTGEHINKTHEHKVCSYGYFISSTIPDFPSSTSPIIYHGSNATAHFINEMQKISSQIANILKFNRAIQLTADDCTLISNQLLCHICGNPLQDDKVRDHDHLTGIFRGMAHNLCNLQFRHSQIVPIFFHNLRGYDSHFLIKEIQSSHSASILANSMEKFISFRIDNLKFIDSLQFLPASIEQLTKSCKEFPRMNAHFNDMDLLRKGAYPYEYVDNISKLNETQLPSQDAFYNSLTNSHISNEDYAFAQYIWDKYKCQSLKDYHDIYLSTDVLLLADIVESFRNLCLKIYYLDPCHYVSAPSLAFDAMLKYTKVELELFKNIDFYLFCEKGIRGGFSVITHRFARANNKYLPDYDSSKASSYIMYLDANNLYGWSMSQKMPHNKFQWESVDKYNFIMNGDVDGDRGYILEVDLQYPAHLHESHSDFPLAPHHININYDMLSDFSKNFVKENYKSHKLCQTFLPKIKYVVHLRNLKQYVELGLVVTNVHRILSFHQSAWLKPYIDYNTQMRQNATSDFEKNFFKLMNNSVFGKLMEDVRRHSDIRLAASEKRILKLASSPQYKRHVIIHDGLVAVELMKKTVILNKPIYAGFSVLDMSKSLMYDFHYNTIKSSYQNKAQLLFTDTDSLCYHITTENIYQDLLSFRNHFDFSDYPVNHILYSLENKKVIGKFKDENNGISPIEFVGLRSKMYSLLMDMGNVKQTMKGIPRHIHHTHSQYKHVLLSSSNSYCNFKTIRSSRHTVHTYLIHKLALSSFDDKRYIDSDGIKSQPYV